MGIRERVRTALEYTGLRRLTLQLRGFTVSDMALYQSVFANNRVLEIGGPSEIFKHCVPVYEVVARADNCLFSSQTVWAEVRAENGFHYHPSKPPGKQFICEATDLREVRASAYDCVLSSHCLEHIANPLRALAEWKRVLKPDGWLLLVVPHKNNPFDWRRPVTPVAHMLEDYKRNMGEDDTSHLAEIVELTDLRTNQVAKTPEELKKWCLENLRYRMMHHHTFDLKSANALVECAGFTVTKAETFKPFQIVVLAAAKCMGSHCTTQ